MSQSTSIFVPRLGLSVTEVKLLQWLVEDGASVNEGQVVCLVETDKTTAEIEAPAKGLLKHQAAPDSVCAVGTAIGEIVQD